MWGVSLIPRYYNTVGCHLKEYWDLRFHRTVFSKLIFIASDLSQLNNGPEICPNNFRRQSRFGIVVCVEVINTNISSANSTHL